MKTFSLSLITLFGLGAVSLADAPKEAKKEPPPAVKMETPKPPAELADYGKAMSGTWKCKGQSSRDGKTMIDVTATITNKLDTDLDKWWLHSSFAATMGKESYKFTGFTTYNASEKKWNRYSVDNMGSAEWASSSGPSGDKTVWEGESHTQMAGMSSAKVRHTEEVKDRDKTTTIVHMFGEMSFDKGKTWLKSYDATCRKG
jgi:hypothetical protein